MSAEGGWRQTAADFFILSTVWRFYVKESAVHVLVVLVVTQLNLKHPSVCCQVILLQLFPFCHWWNFSLWKVENFHSYEKLRTFISRKKRDSSYTLCLRATYLNISVNIPNPQMLGWFPNGFSKPLTLCPVLLPGPNQHISEMILKSSNCIFKLCRILAGPLLITSTTPDLIIPLGKDKDKNSCSATQKDQIACKISHFIKLFITSTVDTGPNMIADFLCLVFILMPGKCSVLYLIIRESESVENPKWGAAIIIYFPAISYAAFLGWIHDFFLWIPWMVVVFTAPQINNLKKK